MLILKHQHGTYGYNFLDICHVYLDRGWSLTPRVSCISDSEHILAPQNEGDDKGQKDTDQDDADKAEGRLLEGDRDIDALMEEIRAYEEGE